MTTPKNWLYSKAQRYEGEIAPQYYIPLWYKRLWRKILKIRTRGTHDEANPLPKGYEDGITIITDAKFNFADRLRILLGGMPEFKISIATENKCGHHIPFQTSLRIKNDRYT